MEAVPTPTEAIPPIRVLYNEGDKPTEHNLRKGTLQYNATDDVLYTVGEHNDVLEIHRKHPEIKNKNWIINGDMSVWQRGIGWAQNAYGPDRWYVGSGRATKAGDPKYDNSLWFEDEGTSPFQQIRQTIELPRDFVGETMTLSFMINHATYPKDGYITVRWSDGSWIEPPIKGLGSNILAEWQKVEWTFVVPDDSSTWEYFDLRILGNGNDGKEKFGFDITNIQLEKGPVATSFGKRSIGLELLLCQRYYVRFTSDGYSVFTSGGFYNSTTSTNIGVVLPTTMYRIPTLGYSDIAHINMEPYDSWPTSIGLNATTVKYPYLIRLTVTDPTARIKGDAVALAIEDANGWVEFNAEIT